MLSFLGLYSVCFVIAGVFIVGYLIFEKLVDFVRWVFRKLFPNFHIIKPKPVYVEPITYTLLHYYNDVIGTFDSFEKAFEKGCSIILDEIKHDFTLPIETKLTAFTSECETASCTYRIKTSNKTFSDDFHIYYNKITCAGYEKMRPNNLVARIF